MNLSKEQIRALHVATIVASLPLTGLLGAITGAVAGIWLQSWVAFFIVLFATIFGIPIRKTKKAISHSVENSRILAASVSSALGRVDYIATAGRGAIAIDAQSRRIAIAGVNEKAVPESAKTFSADNILGFRAYQPGVSMIDLRSSGNGFEAASDFAENLNSQFKAAAQTGLFFSLDDIVHPFAMVQMHYDDAEKWMLLIKKIKEGTLDTQPSPMTYPI